MRQIRRPLSVSARPPRPPLAVLQMAHSIRIILYVGQEGVNRRQDKVSSKTIVTTARRRRRSPTARSPKPGSAARPRSSRITRISDVRAREIEAQRAFSTTPTCHARSTSPGSLLSSVASRRRVPQRNRLELHACGWRKCARLTNPEMRLGDRSVRAGDGDDVSCGGPRGNRRIIFRCASHVSSPAHANTQQGCGLRW